MGSAAGPPVRVIFVNGFHRSGTTVIAWALTEALGAVTTTVGVLAEHIPAVADFLAGSTGGDRGVDRLEVTADTPEEYGFLLNHELGTRALYGHPNGVKLLRAHIEELAAAAPDACIVLKNPWDIGHEAEMLADFPDAAIILVRRRVADIERSLGDALTRSSTSAYARALEPDDRGHERYQTQIHSTWRRRALIGVYRWALRRGVYRLATRSAKLPPDRIALLSYDELRSDPRDGARWAGHLVDPARLADAFAEHAFAEQRERVPASVLQRALDLRWRAAWGDVRARQSSDGILRRELERTVRA